MEIRNQIKTSDEENVKRPSLELRLRNVLKIVRFKEFSLEEYDVDYALVIVIVRLKRMIRLLFYGLMNLRYIV